MLGYSLAGYVSRDGIEIEDLKLILYYVYIGIRVVNNVFVK